MHLTSVNFLEDEIKSVGLFKIFYELDDVLASLAMVEHFNLLEDSSAGVTRNFVDDFDGVLDAGLPVDAPPDDRAEALAEDLQQAFF